MSRGKTSAETATLAGTPAQGERRPGLRAAGAVAARLAAPILARADGILARLKADWPAIVGSEMAAATWPAGLARDGVLKLQVAPERALEIQHRAPIVAERVNLFLGREAVARIVLVQGPLPFPARPRAAELRAISETGRRALDSQVAAVPDPGLREALLRLGKHVAAARDRGD